MAKSVPSLLLLPPPPDPITSAIVSAAYRPTLTAAILALKDLDSSTELHLALPCPKLTGRLKLPRSQVYDELQSLVGSLYSLVCLVCAKLGVDADTDSPGAVDARIVLINYDRTTNTVGHGPAVDPFVSGPIVDLITFATTRRVWNTIFAVESEEGQEFLARYTNYANRINPPLQCNLVSLRGGVSMVQAATRHSLSPTSPLLHNVVAVGGTFDHIHAGHKLLLTATALLLQPTSQPSPIQRRLIVGITGDELLKNKKYAEYLKSWHVRQNDVIAFLTSIVSFTRSDSREAIKVVTHNKPVPNGRAIHTTLKSSLITIECVEIQDVFGPTITDESITALVVSGETRSGGQAVNDKRIEKGWSPLEVFEVDVLDATEPGDAPATVQDFASKISSTAIRKRKAEHTQTLSL
ncbi:hypothetical protein BJ878DRAFT_109568 [Calycina marina]|uniref:Cytidyltransferase-like domain-containing protein n=1 Tax=Calycina marina TaxID=1763456 RepID=A0A9P8CEF7_9HELO|nr:hypothetical protein BJ878DRAFT_109568 [Calycina marina]